MPEVSVFPFVLPRDSTEKLMVVLATPIDGKAVRNTGDAHLLLGAKLPKTKANVLLRTCERGFDMLVEGSESDPQVTKPQVAAVFLLAYEKTTGYVALGVSS